MAIDQTELDQLNASKATILGRAEKIRSLWNGDGEDAKTVHFFLDQFVAAIEFMSSEPDERATVHPLIMAVVAKQLIAMIETLSHLEVLGTLRAD